MHLSSHTSFATSSTEGAKAHARAQAGDVTDSMPVLPASRWPWAPSDVPVDKLVWAETVPGGRYTNNVFARGTRLRFIDVDGTACVHLLLHRADAPWERLNVADTRKVPWQAYLGSGHPLLSDQGRVLATVVADTSGHHDTLCGASTLVGNTEKYGAGEAHSSSPAARELFLLAAAKHGLGPRDLPPSLSFFHGVRALPGGELVSTGSAGPARHVDLLLHLPMVVLAANAAHPLDPAPEYTVGAAQLLAWEAEAELADLPNTDPEYQRALLNTEALWNAANTEGARR
ncbi:urea carboxylase-associated protein 2 [Segniliparus rotundus DSM 44985]|uniref:Urea carboxylase-associated protein 2 n=1 Tax=Segniliparus rotundus (strain ATCC BAA-972 / CDC 1076 / CIP 108378 / DSM 44985 / JCM 13578) TaxID=640132 RepID=D6ZAM3_SEGRD|nr:urea amidolyase associated protein UAAP1 [Segniliparus rotundus]ADG98759.1 urea carboxylase-associated protein 2 [Segniliparus rotundus DSM 44985]